MVFSLTTMIILVLFSLLLKTGCGLSRAGSCKPICTGDNCVTINQDRADFKTAEATCLQMNGKLLTLGPDTDENLLHTLTRELSGNNWIGLRLPAGTCSNLTSPLRGYKWISGGTHGGLVPSWKHNAKVCSPHCVSLSNDHKWTERPCTEDADGYLCRTQHRHACQTQELSDPTVFQSSKGCRTGPCEHQCKEVPGGYKCLCFKGYIADRKDPRRCQLHCGIQSCPAVCVNSDECFCPQGYILNIKTCEDINECDPTSCEHNCTNTFGGYECSCREGFVLQNGHECVKAAHGEGSISVTPVTIGAVRPSNSTLQTSAAATGAFLWMWIFGVVLVVVLLCVMRYFVVKRQKSREQLSLQQTTAASMENES